MLIIDMMRIDRCPPMVDLKVGLELTTRADGQPHHAARINSCNIYNRLLYEFSDAYNQN